jgi:flagellar basal-body rod modification protein FlgD
MTAVDPFASVRAGANTSTSSSSTQNSDNQFGEDTFLKLLVAQLQYQNPLSPQDGTQFLTQTAQFTMVEKLNSIDTEVKSSMAANQTIAASAMIGKQVQYKDPNDVDATGVVSSVKLTADGPLLHIGNDDIAYAAIEQIMPSTGS